MQISNTMSSNSTYKTSPFIYGNVHVKALGSITKDTWSLKKGHRHLLQFNNEVA